MSWILICGYKLRLISNYCAGGSAAVVIAQLIAATDQLQAFAESGRVVPELGDPAVREIVRHPYRIVYRIAALDQVHVLTVHHGSQRFPSEL